MIQFKNVKKIKGENYKPFNEMKELKQVLYDENDAVIPIDSRAPKQIGYQPRNTKKWIEKIEKKI